MVAMKVNWCPVLSLSALLSLFSLSTPPTLTHFVCFLCHTHESLGIPHATLFVPSHLTHSLCLFQIISFFLSLSLTHTLSLFFLSLSLYLFLSLSFFLFITFPLYCYILSHFICFSLSFPLSLYSFSLLLVEPLSLSLSLCYLFFTSSLVSLPFLGNHPNFASLRLSLSHFRQFLPLPPFCCLKF